MPEITTDNHHGWNISVHPENNMCSNFSFDIISPEGEIKHVSLGGDNETRALERAREMIDMEIELSREEFH
jgi:hypothetical protein